MRFSSSSFESCRFICISVGRARARALNFDTFEPPALAIKGGKDLNFQFMMADTRNRQIVLCVVGRFYL